MRPSALLLFLLLLAAGRADAAPPRYVQLVNHASCSVVALQVAARDEAAFRDIALDGKLQGGGDSQTVAVPREGCRYDLRFGFADGRVLRYEDVDLCRHGKVAIRGLPRGGTAREYVVKAGVAERDVAVEAARQAR